MYGGTSCIQAGRLSRRFGKIRMIKDKTFIGLGFDFLGKAYLASRLLPLSQMKNDAVFLVKKKKVYLTPFAYGC